MGIGYETYRAYLDALINCMIKEFGEENLLGGALFGSVVRGEARPESDIDLLFLHLPVGFSPLKTFVHICLDLESGKEFHELVNQSFFPRPSPVFRTEAQLGENPLILLDLLDHGLILYDPLGRLNNLLEQFKLALANLGAKKIVLEDGSWAWDLKPDWKPGEVIEIKL